MSAAAEPSIPQGPYKLGLEEFLCLPDDGRRYEILDGELAVTPAPRPRHQRLSQRLETILIARLQDTGLGEVFHAPVDVVLTDHDIVEPDILFIRRDRLHIVGELRIEGAPDLIVEILSPSTRRRDVLVKPALYARCGVPHCWIVDGDIDRLERYELDPGPPASYRLVAADSAPAVVEPEGFAELRVDLAELFRR